MWGGREADEDESLKTHALLHFDEMLKQKEKNSSLKVSSERIQVSQAKGWQRGYGPGKVQAQDRTRWITKAME